MVCIPYKFGKSNPITFQDMEFYILKHILAHNFCQIIGGATSIISNLDFDLPHNPTKFGEDPPKIKDARVFTRFSYFDPYIA